MVIIYTFRNTGCTTDVKIIINGENHVVLKPGCNNTSRYEFESSSSIILVTYSPAAIISYTITLNAFFGGAMWVTFHYNSGCATCGYVRY